MSLDPPSSIAGMPRLDTGCANEHSHKPSKGPFYRADCLRAKGEGSHTRGRATFRALSPPDHASPTCRTGVRKSLQVWPCKAELCVSPVAFPLTALVRAGRTRGELDLPARRQHDERRGAVSILAIPLSLGCPVPLPPCPSACGTESGESSFVIGSGCPRLAPAAPGWRRSRHGTAGSPPLPSSDRPFFCGTPTLFCGFFVTFLPLCIPLPPPCVEPSFPSSLLEARGGQGAPGHQGVTTRPR
jgi:hypothetical protein